LKKLFEIETEDVEISWSLATSSRQQSQLGIGYVEGSLEVKTLRREVVLSKVWRAEVPETVAFDVNLRLGPKLFEQTSYQIYVRSKLGKRIDLQHADPNIKNGLIFRDNGEVIHGAINFGSEVGFSRFTLVVDGQPEFDFIVEVFPTKLDYKSDYEQLVAETQDYVAGLVFEFIRSTFKLSMPVLAKQSSTVEWLLLLKMIVSELEQAADHIAHHPIRALEHEHQFVRFENIKKFDSFLRKAVIRGAGSGAHIAAGNFQVRQILPSKKNRFTLDTPEHRWIFTQLKRIKDKLTLLRTQEISRSSGTRQREFTARRQEMIDQLERLEHRVLRLQRLEPFRISTETPPPGFASLQLLSAPGYRQCYKACTILSLGLQVEGGPVDLSLKEISSLYEYWCYLTLIHLLAEHTGLKVPVHQLVKSTHSGLQITLREGVSSEVRFDEQQGRRINVLYNPTFSGAPVVLKHRPDMLINIEEAEWPKLSLLLDAKYRIRFDDEYVRQCGAPGPDYDAVNTLHRYRDAIVEDEGLVGEKPKRTIVQAAAVFPFRDNDDYSFRDSKLWKSLDKVGIGAIPLLPANKLYFKEWLSSILSRGGWSIADQAIEHSASQRSRGWQIAAAEPVLVGVLKTNIAEQHFKWIVKNQTYYMPLLRKHPRQLAAKWVAIYLPQPLQVPGAVTHYAQVVDVSVRKRSDIVTPWTSTAQSEDLFAVYTLSPFTQLTNPIENRTSDSRGQRVSSVRWASRLSLERATILSELFLETEQEWRLYEELRAAKIEFYLEPSKPRALKEDSSGWRTWFVTKSGDRIRYAGIHGFIWEPKTGSYHHVPSVDAVLLQLKTKEPLNYRDF